MYWTWRMIDRNRCHSDAPLWGNSTHLLTIELLFWSLFGLFISQVFHMQWRMFQVKSALVIIWLCFKGSKLNDLKTETVCLPFPAREDGMLPRGNNGLASRGRSSFFSPCSLCNPTMSPGLQSEQGLGSDHLPRDLGLGWAGPIVVPWDVHLSNNGLFAMIEAYCLP